MGGSVAKGPVLQGWGYMFHFWGHPHALCTVWTCPVFGSINITILHVIFRTFSQEYVHHTKNMCEHCGQGVLSPGSIDVNRTATLSNPRKQDQIPAVCFGTLETFWTVSALLWAKAIIHPIQNSSWGHSKRDKLFWAMKGRARGVWLQNEAAAHIF